MRANATDNGSKPAIVFEGKTITWQELWRQVEAISGFFTKQLGTDSQQVVDLLMTNSIDFVTTYLAILHAGHIALPIDPAFKKLEIDALVEQIPPKMIVLDERYTKQIGRHNMPKVIAGSLPEKTTVPSNGLRMPAEEQVATLLFTSGTSGKPKAVPNTHRNLTWNVETCSKIWDWTPDDTLLLTLPLSHMHGLVIGISGAVYHGNTIYLHQQSFQAEVLLNDLGSGKITMFTHTPTAYQKMLEYGGDYDLSGVRICISGSAPLPPAVFDGFKQRFGIEITETYGTTETGRIAGNRLGIRMVGSPGKPFPGVDLKLSKDSEVLVKSPGVFPGYYLNPEATKTATTADGYWRTGDTAEIKDGYVFLKGRVQEKIKRYGYSVSPRDVEWALRKNPRVKDICAVGLQEPGQADDKLFYFIVSDLNDEQINDYCKTNLFFAWRPDRIVHMAELPKSPTGKLKINKLKQLAKSA